ncbi:MAG: GGDEF domain-containing protein [Oscillospiraceae bacterium]|nr:GGDEF domain-containing protein [Oscillospiraceae bacterium]
MEKNKSFKRRSHLRALGTIGMALLVITLVVLVTWSQMITVTTNNVSMLHGATQRLVKLELCGYPDDDLINTLDGVMENLLTGRGRHRLVRLQHSAYMESLTRQSQSWQTLRQAILNYRNGNETVQLILLSEEYYDISGNTLQLARQYVEAVNSWVRFVNVLVVGMLLLYLWSTLKWLSTLTEKNSRLKQQTQIDAFTELPNRAAAQAVLDSHTTPQSCIGHACLMFDLDNLKTTNDTQGHRVGDDLIVTFAGILRSYSSEGVFVARIGGDEFLLVTGEGTLETAEQILDSIDKRTQVHNSLQKDLYLSYSVGIAVNDAQNPLNLQQLMQLADSRMYENKRANKLAETNF